MRIFYPNSSPPGLQPNGKPWPELRLDQLEAIYRLIHEVQDADRSKAALVGAGMGSGKTVVSAEVIIATKPKRCLIVGTKSSYGQWRDSLRDQGYPVPMLRIDATLPGRDNLKRLLNGDDGLFYIGLEMLRAQDWEVVSETHPTNPSIKAFFGDDIPDTIEVKRRVHKRTYATMEPVDLIISDEAHKHANQKSAAIATMESIPARAKIALSGTFFGNKFINAWSLCVWLWGKDVIGGKGKFERDWCVKVPVMSKDGKKQITTRSGFPVSKIIGERSPGEFVETLPCYVFIATPIGPVPKPEVVKIDLHAEQMRQYIEMQDQSLTWVPTSVSAARAPLVADIPLTQRNRLRTAALGGMTLVPGASEGDSDSIRFDPGCKSSTLTELHSILHRPTWVGKKALILTHSKQFAIETARRVGLKYATAIKTGDTTEKQWEIDKARFMLPPSDPDSIQYLVAVISAVGTSTDGLQANCAKVVWLSEDDSNVNNIQGANRVWRDGVNLDEYEAVKIVQRNTIAEGVLAKNDSHRTDVLDSITGNG